MQRGEESRRAENRRPRPHRSGEDWQQAAAEERFLNKRSEHNVEQQKIREVDEVAGRSGRPSDKVNRHPKSDSASQRYTKIEIVGPGPSK